MALRDELGTKMKEYKKEDEQGHSYWYIDKDIPIFKGEDRKYIEDLIYIGE